MAFEGLHLAECYRNVIVQFGRNSVKRVASIAPEALVGFQPGGVAGNESESLAAIIKNIQAGVPYDIPVIYHCHQTATFLIINCDFCVEQAYCSPATRLH